MLDLSQLRHLFMLAVLVAMVLQFSGLVKHDLVPYTALLVGVTVAAGGN